MTSPQSRDDRSFVADEALGAGGGGRKRGCAFDAAVVVALVGVWWLCLSGPVGQRMPLSDDTFRDAAYAENILHGRIAADPSMNGLPYWYAPGGPLVYALASKLTGLRPLELYSRSVLWVHVWIPIAFYLVVRRYWDRPTAVLALALVCLCSRWWPTRATMVMPSIQGMILVLVSLGLWHAALRRGRAWAVLLGVALAACSWHHILSGIIASGAIGCHALFWTRGGGNGQRLFALKRAALAGGVCALLVLPLAWHLLSLPINNPAPPTHYEEELDDPAYALMTSTPLIWPLAVVGLVIVGRRLNSPPAWVLGYLAVGLAGQAVGYANRHLRLPTPILLPHEFQWHSQLAVGILAAVGLMAAARWLGHRSTIPRARRTVLPASAAAMLAVVVWPNARTAFDGYDQYWRTARCGPDVAGAAEWIRANSDIADVFVCGYLTGYYEIAGRTGRKLVLMPECRANIAADVTRRRHDLARMKLTTDPNEFLALAVDRYGARFVYLSSGEPILAQRWAKWDIFETAYRSPEGKRTVLRIVDRRDG